MLFSSPPVHLPMSRITPNHDKSTLITDSTGRAPPVFEGKLFSTWEYLTYLYHYGSNKIVFDSDHMSWLLPLHNLPSDAALAANYDDLVLAVHHHRCVTTPLLAEDKDAGLS